MDGVIAPQLSEIVALLRDERSDTADIEVKRASGGFPKNLASTVSAMTNKPGGGTIVLGLDESADFAPVGVYDVAECQKALASLARDAMKPPVKIDISTVDFEGTTVVVGHVHETPPSEKPAMIRANRKSYVRSYDGDYELADNEVQRFIATRSKPTFDLTPVDAGPEALDKALADFFLATMRNESRRMNKYTDDEILLNAGVMTSDGKLTLAGLLALGDYPQRWYPSLGIEAAMVLPDGTDDPEIRVADRARFDGPIPDMLDDAVRWVVRNTATRIVFGADGHGRDVHTYPIKAVRELIANALVHRDLGPHANNEPISLRLTKNQLVIANPGGLWSMTVGRLGTVGPTARRNEALVRILQNVMTQDGRRVIEGLGTGIRAVLDSLDSAGMTRPRFVDNGIAFTVLVPNHALLNPADIEWISRVAAGARLNDVQRHVLASMRHGVAWTNRELRQHFPMDSVVARVYLQGLVDAGLAEVVGDRGSTQYRLNRALVAEPENSRPHDAADEPPSSQDADTGGGMRTRNAAVVLDALSGRALTFQELGEQTGLTAAKLRWALMKLRENREVEVMGGQGVKGSRYRLVD
ncbi:RNA-binding domain-containing protein [Myceligenerans crystallogenes]